MGGYLYAPSTDIHGARLPLTFSLRSTGM